LPGLWNGACGRGASNGERREVNREERQPERTAGYHPAVRALGWALPAVAAAAAALILLAGGDGDPPRAERLARISPPASIDVPPVGFADIDTILAGGVEAFEERDFDESARLLSRARFFVESGIREGVFDRLPPNLELAIGLSEFYRGYPVRAAESLESAVDDDPGDETAAWYLARIYLETGREDEARKMLEKVAALGGVYSASARDRLEKM